MFWKRLPERFRSLGFRLGMSYALIFGLVSSAGICALYVIIASHLMHEADSGLMDQKRALEHYAAFHDDRVIQGKFIDEAGARGTSRVFYSLISPLGERLVSSDASAWQDMAWDTNWLVQAAAQGLIFTDLSFGRKKARVLTAAVTPERFLQITISLKEETAFLAKVRAGAVIFVLAMGAAGIGAGILMARKALKGLDAVTLAVRRVAGGDFKERVAVQGTGIEMMRLGRTYNQMADRIESLIREMTQVNDNIAHDLRSPVTRIRGLAEMAAGDPALPEQGMEALGSIVEECDRLVHLINTMLEISEAQTGLGDMTPGSMPASELISGTMEMFVPLAEENQVVLETVDGADFTVFGDLGKIQRALSNLVDNAIKYTPSGGQVRLSAALENKTARITVTDTGMGISPHALPRIFERFYRADQSRSLPGNGLGLSLAMAFAKAHNGTIEIHSVPGAGTTCTLSLPCPAPPSFPLRG